MGKPLKPRTVLLLGSLSMAALMAVLPILVGMPGDLLRGALAGGLFGSAAFGALAWAVRPTAGSPRILRLVMRVFGAIGLLGSAVLLPCVWLDERGPLLIASTCAFFAGYSVACIAGIRLEHLQAPAPTRTCPP